MFWACYQYHSKYKFRHISFIDSAVSQLLRLFPLSLHLSLFQIYKGLKYNLKLFKILIMLSYDISCFIYINFMIFVSIPYFSKHISYMFSYDDGKCSFLVNQAHANFLILITFLCNLPCNKNSSFNSEIILHVFTTGFFIQVSVIRGFFPTIHKVIVAFLFPSKYFQNITSSIYIFPRYYFHITMLMLWLNIV